MSEAMSQPPVEPAGNAQRGPYRHDGVPAAAPDYGRPAGYSYPGSRYGHIPQGAQDPGSSDNFGYYGYDQPAQQPDYRYASHDDQQPYREAQPGYASDQGGYRQLSAVLILDDGSNRYHQLSEGTMVVGRGHDAQFRLPDTGVSRRHLEITWDGRTARLTDLGSTNGTTVNGTPVQSGQLVDGDVVRVGQSRLVFRTEG